MTSLPTSTCWPNPVGPVPALLNSGTSKGLTNEGLTWRAPKTSAETASALSTGDKKTGKDKEKDKDKDSVEDLLKLDELSLEVGYGLVPLVDQNQGGQLLARVKALRQNLATQLGFIVPPVHITDNVRLKPREYVVSLRVVEVARWEMLQDQMMAISSEGSPRPLAGTATKEPAFGVAAVWIPAALQNQALASGYAVVDQTSVLATHLAEVVKQHAHELLSRQEVKRLLDRLAESHPKLVEELVPKILSLGEVQKVLQQLLREQVSIRDLPSILETMLDTAATTKNPIALVESVRQGLGRALVRPLLSDSGGLRVVTLDHALEEELGRAFSGQPPPAGSSGLQPPFARRILDGLRRLAGDQVAVASPVVLCSTPARYHLKRLLEPFLPKVVVLSPLEVPPVIRGAVGRSAAMKKLKPRRSSSLSFSFQTLASNADKESSHL